MNGLREWGPALCNRGSLCMWGSKLGWKGLEPRTRLFAPTRHRSP